jgi:hypothetical protein
MKIDGATEQWALDFRRSNGDTLDMDSIVGNTLYIKREPVCPSDGDYSNGSSGFTVGTDPECSIGTTSQPYVEHVLPDASAFNG